MNIFVKNTLVTFITNICLLVLGTLSTIIIARILGPEGRGVYSLAILLPTLLITFTNLGVGPASIYYTGKKLYHPKEVFGANVIFSGAISLIAVLVGLLLVYFGGPRFFPHISSNYLYLALILVPTHIFFAFTSEIFLGLQEIKKFNFFVLFQALLFLIFISAFLLGLKFGIKAAILADFASYTIASVVLFLKLKRDIGGIFFNIKKKIVKDFLAYSSKIYLTNIISFLHLRVDTYMINIFLDPTAVGLYSVAVSIAERIWIVSQSAGTVLFPKVSAEKDREKLKNITPIVCRNVLFISVILSLILIIFAKPLIIFLFSEEFLGSISSFNVLLIGTIAVSGARILANDLSGRNRFKENIYINIFSVILNIALNIILIPKMGIVGSAWATAISYSVMFILRGFIYAKISQNKVRDVFLVKISDFRYYQQFANNLRDIISRWKSKN